MVIEVKFEKPTTYFEATVSQTWYYDSNEIPVDPSILVDKLNEFFNIDNFYVGKPRVANEKAISIKWPKWRNERKPIKMKLQEGISINF